MNYIFVQLIRFLSPLPPPIPLICANRAAVSAAIITELEHHTMRKPGGAGGAELSVPVEGPLLEGTSQPGGTTTPIHEREATKEYKDEC